MSQQIVVQHDLGAQLRITGLVWDADRSEILARGMYRTSPSAPRELPRNFLPIRMLADPASGWKYLRTEIR